MDKIFEKIELRLKQDHQVTPNEATVYQIRYNGADIEQEVYL